MILPMNDLRESPTRIGAPKAAEAIEVPDAGMVLLRRLAEADARIEQNTAERHAGARGEVERAFEETLDIIENVDRRVRLLAVVHDDEGGAGIGYRIRHAGIALKAPDVVDDQTPSRAASRATAAFPVSMETGASKSSASASSTGRPVEAPPPARLKMAGPGQFAANVDDRRALGDHRPGARDGRPGARNAVHRRKTNPASH